MFVTTIYSDIRSFQSFEYLNIFEYSYNFQYEYLFGYFFVNKNVFGYSLVYFFYINIFGYFNFFYKCHTLSRISKQNILSTEIISFTHVRANTCLVHCRPRLSVIWVVKLSTQNIKNIEHLDGQLTNTFPQKS